MRQLDGVWLPACGRDTAHARDFIRVAADYCSSRVDAMRVVYALHDLPIFEST